MIDRRNVFRKCYQRPASWKDWQRARERTWSLPSNGEYFCTHLVTYHEDDILSFFLDLIIFFIIGIESAENVIILHIYHLQGLPLFLKGSSVAVILSFQCRFDYPFRLFTYISRHDNNCGLIIFFDLSFLIFDTHFHLILRLDTHSPWPYPCRLNLL
jgi:hypothetical protein